MGWSSPNFPLMNSVQSMDSSGAQRPQLELSSPSTLSHQTSPTELNVDSTELQDLIPELFEVDEVSALGTMLSPIAVLLNVSRRPAGFSLLVPAFWSARRRAYITVHATLDLNPMASNQIKSRVYPTSDYPSLRVFWTTQHLGLLN